MQTEADTFAAMCALSPFFWAQENKIKLGGSTWTLRGHEYQVGMLTDEHRVQCDIKGAQMGVSENHVLRTLHGHIFGKYKKGSLYLFPTRDDVADFSKSRFGPLIDNNPCIGNFVQSTDSTNIKKIHEGFLYLRGTRSSSQLKSIPVDRIVFDERDEMPDDKVDLALERVSHSDVQEIVYLSTPTIPDYGIDEIYQRSDQRVWMIRCEKCGKETCLELEFPSCLKEVPGKYSADGQIINVEDAGRVYRACIHCDAEIYPRKGRWVVRESKNSSDIHGRWISQLNSIYVEPGTILKLFNDPPHGNITEVYNSKLGMVHIAAENRLTLNQVYGVCSRDAMETSHNGPCCAGVDVGKVLNVVIGCRPSANGLKVLKVAETTSFNDLYDLLNRFNVKSTVIDLKPEIHKVRDFQAANKRFRVFACDYQEHQRGVTSWDEKQGNVIVNRTEICDATHELFETGSGFELPRRCNEIDIYARQMCNIAKVLEENPETGSKEYRYRKLSGADHYRHATNYLLLASERVGQAGTLGFLRGYLNKRKGRSFMTA